MTAFLFSTASLSATVLTVAELGRSPEKWQATADAKGVYVSWLFNESAGAVASVAFISAGGQRPWGPQGKSIQLTTGSSVEALDAHPLTDGLLFVWRETSPGAIRVQMLGANGLPRWPQPLALTEASEGTAAIGADRAHFAVFWPVKEGDSHGLRWQRFDFTGKPVMTTLPWVGLGSMPVNDVLATSDGQGGFFVVWRSGEGIAGMLMAQHLGNRGQPIWPTEGVIVSDQRGRGRPRRLRYIPARQELAVLWQDETAAGVEWSAQRLDAGGVRRWDESGLMIAEEAHDHSNAAVDIDSEGIITAAWEDVRLDPPRVLVQQWNERAVPLADVQGTVVAEPAEGEERDPLLTPGRGETQIFWRDNRQQPWELFGQRWREGQRRGTPSGTRLALLGSQFDKPLAVGDDAGNAYILWADPTGQRAFQIQLLKVSNGNVAW